MFGAITPPQELPLTVMTDKMVIRGTALTRVRRLTDLVAGPDTHYLVLQDASFLELGSRRTVIQGASVQIPLSDVLFLHSTAPTESGATMRIPKAPVEATILVPPFTVEGTIYLPWEAELRIALDAYMEQFLPVTAARYWAYGAAESSTSVDLLVVNHARAHVVIAAGVEWQSDSAPAAADEGSNPW